MPVIYSFPPWDRHRVSVYKAVTACSQTAYKFPRFPIGITTRSLLNNLCFTFPLREPLVSFPNNKFKLHMSLDSPIIDKFTFLTPAAANDHIMGLTGISFGRPWPKPYKGVPALVLSIWAGSDGDPGWSWVRRYGEDLTYTERVVVASFAVTTDQSQKPVKGQQTGLTAVHSSPRIHVKICCFSKVFLYLCKD